ncbi:THAP-type domain-containing protein [Trichonephila clavipes]|nr:THAP-type domain-containing protein [Trichonephila clavipes]
MSSPRKSKLGTMCSAVGCSMRSGTNLLSAVKMYRFPTNPSRRLQWEAALQRKNWKANPKPELCNKHFITGKPSSDAEHPDYVPSIFASMKNKGSSSSMNRYNRQEQIRPGDVIFADRSFPVKDLVAEREASLVLPASTKGKKQLSSAEVISSRKVSRLRVHIERCIERLKTFRILKSLWPISFVNNKTSEETCIGDDVIFVVAALCNILKGRLIRQM